MHFCESLLFKGQGKQNAKIHTHHQNHCKEFPPSEETI
jgi:hypothetical protein